jgi:hypothetical protein
MKATRIILGVLLLIVALNAFGGGWYALAGAENVPLEWLEGSPFDSYFIPGLFLLVVVGGMCLISALMLFFNAKKAMAVTRIAGGVLLGWILIQLLIIGYVSFLQPTILTAAVIVLILSTHPKLAPHAK